MPINKSIHLLQIILSIVGAAFASVSTLAGVPLAYAAAYTFEPRKSFEYSSSVHTADYTNFAHVKSDNAGLTVAAAPIIATPAVHAVEIKSIPTPIITAEHPIVTLKTPEHIAAVVDIREAAPIVRTTDPFLGHIVAPQLQYTRQYIQPAAYVAPSAHFAAPIVRAIEPIRLTHVVPTTPEIIHHTVEPLVEVKAVHEPTIAIHQTLSGNLRCLRNYAEITIIPIIYAANGFA